MANIYEIQRVFDDAVTSAGITINDPSMASSDDIEDSVAGWSFIDEVALSEEQVGQYLTIDFNYNIEFIRDVVSTSDNDVIARKIQAGDDWELIYKTIFNSTGISSAQKVEILDGSFSANTEKETQSYGNMTVRVQHKFKLC